MSHQVDGPNGRSLWQRADRSLPGGLVYISQSARMAGPQILPGFIRSAEGCRVKDVDGREYIDFLCGNGPNLLGYRHPEVEAAAGMATLEIYQRDRVFEQLEAMGRRLTGDPEKAGREAGHRVTLSGPATMPTLLFDGEQATERAQHFAQQAALRGAIFHPSLNWFLSAAHTTADIDQAIAIAREAFRATPNL